MSWQNANIRSRFDLQDDTGLREALLLGLDLLQGVQQHRGLGQVKGAGRRSEGLANALSQSWEKWSYPAHHQAWQLLRRNPVDFDGHSRLLEDLLSAIEYFELQRCAGTLQPPNIAQRCWELEDLGRLRGLSMRAATFQACPLEMLIQLQYLHGRLMTNAPRSLASALEQLQSRLINSARVSIQPDECYALLTPLVDERLDEIRRVLGRD